MFFKPTPNSGINGNDPLQTTHEDDLPKTEDDMDENDLLKTEDDKTGDNLPKIEHHMVKGNLLKT